MRFTDSQKDAINTRDKNLTLSAGAGSGKTTVLVSRYITLLSEKEVGIAEILAITFTNKSAADMRIKVRKHISAQIKSTSGSKRKFWQNIKDQFEKATISTIHSFALQVLRNHPLESKINPESSMIDEVEAYILLSETIREVLRKHYQDEDLQTVVQAIKSVDRTIDIIASIYNKIRSLGCEIESAACQALSYQDDKLQELTALKQIITNNLLEISNIISNYSGKAKFAEKVRNCNITALSDVINRAVTYQDGEVNEAFNTLVELLKSPIKDAKEVVTEVKDAQSEMVEILAYLDTVPMYKLLAKILLEIDKKYSELKKSKRALDYSDLEWGLLNLLKSNQEVRNYYIDKYKYVMVDEFQDTSPMQQELIKLLSPYDKNGLFIVGDPRQSIYRFRAAELSGFLEMRNEIMDGNGKSIYLAENFRSRTALIDFQNEFFNYLFGQSKLDYQNVVPGILDECKDSKVELWLSHPDEITDEMKSADLRKIEARYIAQNIRKLNKEGVKYQEVAILFRALTDINVFEAALADEGIPYQVSGSRGLFEKQEIVDLINILKYFSQGNDEISLLGILRSPLFGFSDEELLRIRIENKAIDKTLKLENEAKYNEALAYLSKYKDKLKLNKISEVLNEIIIEKDYYSTLLLSKDYGKQAVANIHKFLAIIRDLEASNKSTIIEVLEYLEVMRKGNALMGEASVSEEIDVVQLMSIHQSKGLEFNTVIIPQLERRILSPQKDMICFTKELGLVIRTRGYADNTLDNFYFTKMKEMEKELDLEESYRLFYVGATRAEERLILSAAPPRLNYTKQSYFDYLREYLEIDEMPVEQEEKKLVKIVPQRTSSRHQEKDEKKFNDLKPKLLIRSGFKIEEGLSLSATALMTHNECSRKYYYSYIRNIPDYEVLEKNDKNKYSASELGTIIHKVFELTNGNDAEDLLETLLAKVNKASNVISQYRYNGKRMIKNYLNSAVYQMQLIKDAEEVSELVFNLNIDKKILTGLIDKLIINGKKYSIIDLKTGVLSKESENKYLLQNAVYALAVYHAYQVYPSELINYFVNENESKDYKSVLESYDDSKKLVSESLEALLRDLKGNNFKRNLESCEVCNYKKLCTRKGGANYD